MILKCSYEKLDTIWLQILLVQLKPHPEMHGKPADIVNAQVFDVAACEKLRYDNEPGAMATSCQLILFEWELAGYTLIGNPDDPVVLLDICLARLTDSVPLSAR